MGSSTAACKQSFTDPNRTATFQVAHHGLPVHKRWHAGAKRCVKELLTNNHNYQHLRYHSSRIRRACTSPSLGFFEETIQLALVGVMYEPANTTALSFEAVEVSPAIYCNNAECESFEGEPVRR